MHHYETYIEKSKENCANVYGMKPEEIPFLKVSLTSKQLDVRKQKFESMRVIIKQFMQKILSYTVGTPTLVIATDREGYVLDIYGDEGIHEMVEVLGITKGVRFAEEDVGTNSVSLALAYGEAIQLIGEDHYHYCLEGMACFSAPFSYENNNVAGTISLMTTKECATPFYLGLLSSAVDTIEREMKVQHQNERLHLMHQVLMDATPLGIVMTNQWGEIKELNESAENMTGTLEDDLKGKAIEGLPELSELVRQTINEKRKLENIEVTISHQDRPCLVDVTPLFDRSQFIGVFAQIRDMKSYHELQKRVIQSEKLSAIGKLGAGFAHEIRNPLTSVIGLTQLIQEEIDDHHEGYLKVMRSELERMRSLVEQFVMMGKPKSTEKKVEDLPHLIQDTLYLMESYARFHRVSLQFDPSIEKLQISIDGSQLKQVLINFIKNAVEAQPDGGSVVIRLQNEASSATVSIEDKGIGIPQKMIQQLGSPFLSTKEEGLGMGVAISLDLIKAHQGTLDVQSTEGVGTTVTFTLPV
jgi:two-component system, sporulation sensor kinase E